LQIGVPSELLAVTADGAAASAFSGRKQKGRRLLLGRDGLGVLVYEWGAKLGMMMGCGFFSFF
jgi:hypothetical protein